MHSDSFFFIGKQHSVCQDYARASVGENGPFAILSDGCSGSPDTDFGARILVQLFATEVHNFTNLETTIATEAAFRLGGQAAKLQLKELQLPENSLDATLMMAAVFSDHATINVIGDGVVAFIDDDNEIEIIEIEYPSGAPRYLSYWIDDDRHELYKKEFGTKAIAKRYILESSSPETEDDHSSMVYNIALNSQSCTAVVLLSDGVHSFQRPVETDTGRTFEPVPTRQVLQELLAYKSYKGEFVKRRTKRFIKEMQKRGWVNNDDLSVAAIYLGEK